MATVAHGLRAPLSGLSMSARRSGTTSGASKMSTKDMILSKTKFASGGARVAGDDKEVGVTTAFWRRIRVSLHFTVKMFVSR